MGWLMRRHSSPSILSSFPKEVSCLNNPSSIVLSCLRLYEYYKEMGDCSEKKGGLCFCFCFDLKCLRWSLIPRCVFQFIVLLPDLLNSS